MKASELIKQLQQIIETQGDVDIFLGEDDSDECDDPDTCENRQRKRDCK